VEDGRCILSSVVASQLDTHGLYGGVVPELASREHLRAIAPVVREALDRASCSLSDLAAIAVTEGPGLVGSLLVGVTYAKALCFAADLPLIAVNHVEGHIAAVLLEQLEKQRPVSFPALALVVSGGHTHLFEMPAPGRYRLLGKTRDDAAGEAYDKVAKLLGFGYPGGPTLDALAPFGNGKAVRFTRPRMKGNELDFSFSGLKTAVLRWVEQHEFADEIAARRQLLKANPRPSIEEWRSITPQRTLDLIASFQRSVVDELLSHMVESAERIGAASVIVSGGVACNRGLRLAAAEYGSYQFFFPSPTLSTDNAVMIAAAAFAKWEQGCFAGFDLRAKANLALG
jgi:N6-L-threonylcarbamoyladenine synthase